MHVALLVLFGLLGCVVSGCIILPIPIPTSESKVLTGRRVTDEETASLQAGVTTKTEVIALLGEPDVCWEDQRICAYKWTVRRAMALVLTAFFIPMAGGTVSGTTQEIGRDYTLFMQFDMEGVVTRFTRLTGSPAQAYRELLIQWGKQTEETDTSVSPPLTQTKR